MRPRPIAPAWRCPAAPVVLGVALMAVCASGGPAGQDPALLSDLYVDPVAGSDASAGSSPSAPLRTLQAVLARLRQRPSGSSGGSTTTVHLRSGRHHRTQPLLLDSACSNVVFKTWVAEGGAAPRGSPFAATVTESPAQAAITGGMTVPAEAWHQDPSDKGLWTAEVHGLGTHIPQQLFVNGGRRQRARHPNLFAEDGITVRDFPYLYWAKPLCPSKPPSKCSDEARYGFFYNATDDRLMASVAAAQHQSRDLQAVVYHGWTASRHHVRPDGIGLANRTIRFKNPANWPIGHWSGRSSEGGQRFYLENSRVFLDGAGEWWLNTSVPVGQPSVVHYRPLPGEDIQRGIDAVLPTLETLVIIDAAQNVTFTGLSLEHSDWHCGGADGTESCDHQSVAWQQNAGVQILNSSGVTLSGCAIRHHGAQAVWAAGASRGIALSRCEISDLGTGAVRVGNASTSTDINDYVRNVSITNCNITDGGWAFPGGTAILVHAASHVTVEHNDVSRFSYTAVSLGWSWSYNNYPVPSGNGYHVVRGNRIHHLGFPRRETGDAMACVYTLGQLNGTVVDGNLCHDVRAYMSGGYGLSQDQGSEFINFTNNVCIRTTGSPHNTHYGQHLLYENNLFFGGGWDSWVPPETLHGYPAALRTSPSLSKPCPPYKDICPDQLEFVRNLVGLWNNDSALLFEGDFSSSSDIQLNFTFRDNLYFAQSPTANLSDPGVHRFGGKSFRFARKDGEQLSWEEWQQSGQDTKGSILPFSPNLGGGGGVFADPRWAETMNVTVVGSVESMGWRQIDTSACGIQPDLE